MAQKQKLYFAYGSNLLRKQMTARCPQADYQGIGWIRGWRFEYDGGLNEGWQDLPVGNIVPGRHERVWGVLYLVNEMDIQRLDGFENIPRDYQHRLIPVHKSNGKTVKAFVYTRSARPIGQPSAMYRKVVVNGAVEDGLPATYIQGVLAK